MLVRVPADSIREVGRNTQGVRVVRLKDGDAVVGVASAPMEESDSTEAVPPPEASPESELRSN
jgi:DNA gyrase subunit A